MNFNELIDEVQQRIAQTIKQQSKTKFSVRMILGYMNAINPLMELVDKDGEQGFTFADQAGMLQQLSDLIVKDYDKYQEHYVCNMNMIELLLVVLDSQMEYALAENALLMQSDEKSRAFNEALGNLRRNMVLSMSLFKTEEHKEANMDLVVQMVRATKNNPSFNGFMTHLMNWMPEQVIYTLKDFDSLIVRGNKHLLVNRTHKTAYTLVVTTKEARVGSSVKFPGIHKTDKVYEGSEKDAFLESLVQQKRDGRRG